ncbi:MAG: hypothetical protein K2K16_09820 [Ruminococcus sp.]|nr:hypothetical protein [Ruminococcus sp.]
MSHIFVRNKNRCEVLKEKLTDSEMVFATENGISTKIQSLCEAFRLIK